MRERGPTRRALLGGWTLLAAALAAACGPFRAADGPEREDPDLAIVRRVIAAEEAILARYTAARRMHPNLAARLDPITAHHREHVAALRRRLGTAAASAAPSSRPPTGSPVPAPDAPDSAIAMLAAEEDAAARARVDDVARASPALAQLLASVGASEAGHAALLTEEG